MARPKGARGYQSSKERLHRWLDEYPTGWLAMSLRDIARATHLSYHSVLHYLDIVMAERGGGLPTDYEAKRKAADPKALKAEREAIKVIQLKKEGQPLKNIIFLTGKSETYIRKVVRENAQKGQEQHAQTIRNILNPQPDTGGER